MSQSLKHQPFDLKLGDEVKVVVLENDKSYSGRIAMSAAPVYEIKLEDDSDIVPGSKVRCEPTRCPRQSRILATVLGNKLGETKIWITAMELQVGVEREPRFPARGMKAVANEDVGNVELRDVSNSGLSFTTKEQLTPGIGLEIEVLAKDEPVKLKIMVMHVTQEVGMPVAMVGCRIISSEPEHAEAWKDIVKHAQTPHRPQIAS